jgi:hypothetical protein
LLVDELDKVDHAFEAQSFKRACSCFGLGRYLYYFTDQALQQKLLGHMQAAERGFRQLDAALERVGPEALTKVLRSVKLQSIDQVDNLQTLREIVLAIEGTALGTTTNQ